MKHQIVIIQVISALAAETSSSGNALKIYQFAQNNFGLDDEKAKEEDWVGAIDISFGDNIIIYGKIDEPDGIYETLELTNADYQDFLIQSDILQITN